MESQHQEDEGRRFFPVIRRRRVIAAVIAMMMLVLGVDYFEEGEHSATSPGSTGDSSVVTGDSNAATVDEFDVIEALLAKTDNQRIEGRGPTVEVPPDISFAAQRPTFDFDAFDKAMGSQRLVANERALTSKPPERDSFDDLNRVNVLEIPESMALGNGNRVHQSESQQLADSGSMQLADDKTGTLHQNAEWNKDMPPSALEIPAVQILPADVTTSRVTHFDSATEQDSVISSERIRFTGMIVPAPSQTAPKPSHP